MEKNSHFEQLHRRRLGDLMTEDFLDFHKSIKIDDEKLANFPSDGNDLRGFRQEIGLNFMQTQITLEHKFYLDKKKWCENSPLSAWVFGSADRQMLFWMMAIQPIGEGFSPKLAGEYLQRGRTIVSKELTAMHDIGLIYRNPKEGFQRYYLPSKQLINAALWFAEYYVDTTLTATEHDDRRKFFEYRQAEMQYFSGLKKRADDAQ